MDEHLVRELGGDGLHRVHVAERGAEDQVESLAGQAAEHLLCFGALGHVLDIGHMRIRHVLFEVKQPFVVGLRITAIVMRADEDRRHIELALFDLRDLEPTDFFSGFRSAG